MTTYSTPREAKKLGRTARPGDRLYTIHKGYGRFPGAPSEYYSEHVVGRGRGVSGGAMLEGPGYTSVEGLVLRDGPVYTDRPRGMPNLDGPLPQVEGPLGLSADEIRQLSRSELHDLAKQNRLNREERKRLLGI